MHRIPLTGTSSRRATPRPVRGAPLVAVLALGVAVGCGSDDEG